MSTLIPSASEQARLSRSGLYRAKRAGESERIARRIYVHADALPADWDWIEAATRRPEATLCSASALAHYDPADTIPAAPDVAISRGSRTPSGPGAIRWRRSHRQTLGIGR